MKTYDNRRWCGKRHKVCRTYTRIPNATCRAVCKRTLMHTPASAKNRLCPYRWYYTSVPTGIRHSAYGRPASAGRCVRKPDSLKILAPCGTQASIKKTVDKYGRRSTRARTSIPLEDPVVPDDPPHTHIPNGAARGALCTRGCVRSELNRLRCLVHSRLGGLGRNHSTW